MDEVYIVDQVNIRAAILIYRLNKIVVIVQMIFYLILKIYSFYKIVYKIKLKEKKYKNILSTSRLYNFK